MVKARVLGAVGIVALAGCLADVLAAQSTTAKPAFDVASVKPHDPSSDRYCLFDVIPPARRLTARACLLANLIRYAYGLDASQVVMPERAVSGSFDILASFRDAGNPTRQDVLVMLQQLLAERFHLVAHDEQRPVPVYALVLARKDGKLGKAMNRSPIDCEKWIAEGRGRAGEGAPSLLTPNHKANACGTIPGFDFLVGRTATTAELASRLEVIVGRRVVDRTGLTGGFDFDLKFSRRPLTVPTANDAAADPSDDAPLIFTAIQEQLGLKLEPRQEPIDVLVIDHVEHLTAD
jgi:uncharacterized protein (TIGR03435 family)